MTRANSRSRGPGSVRQACSLSLATALASGTETAIAVEPGGEAHVLFADRLHEVGTWMTLASICAGDAPP